jgi:diguanylate cyclase (GGDEF)-like protein/PAS domain S-box-containing protein
VPFWDRIRAGELVSQTTHEHAEAILAAMADGYCLTIGGRVIAVNQSLCDITGFDRDQLLGSSPPLPFDPCGRLPRTQEPHDRPTGQRGHRRELTLVRASGDYFEAEITTRSARESDGSVLGTVMTVRDVSDRRRHEAECEQERRDLLDVQRIAGLGSWDQALTPGSVGRWSDELWRMLGLKPRPQAPALDEFLLMIDPSERDQFADALGRSQVTGAPWSGEFRLWTPDARELHISFHNDFRRDGNGNPISVLRTVQDITERFHHDAEQAALTRIASLVAHNAPPAAVFASVAEEVQRLFAAQAGMVSRFDLTRGTAAIVSAHSAEGQILAGRSCSLDGAGASACAYRSGAPARFDRDCDSPLEVPASAVAVEGLAGGIAAPIVVAGQLWGTLAATFDNPPVPARAEHRLGRFSDLVAMAIANAETWETLSRQASTDPLTGIANHRTFHDRLASEIERARRYDRDLSVVMFDLDHFKQINDTFGHRSGDKVLAEFARRLTAECRDGTLVARIGGEEFAWLIPEASSRDAVQAAERVRRAVETQPFETVGKVTVSAGICAVERGLNGEDVVRFADRALYWAKDGGRNTTFLYTSEAHALLSRERHNVEKFQAMSSVRALARAIDSKDSSTAEHSERVAAIAEELALALGWTQKRARQLHSCGLLHDVGKIGIPDEILLRPGPLTVEERELVKGHAAMSATIAAEVLEHDQVTWIRGHHERWDGRGYPDGLAGDAIPDGAQLLAAADAWDVMTRSRTYQLPKSPEEALAEVLAESGRQFAPAAAQALRQVGAQTLTKRAEASVATGHATS